MPRGALPEHPALLVTHPADAERAFLNGEPACGLREIKPRYASATAGPRVLPLPRAPLREGPNEIVFSSLLAGLNARFSMGPFLLGERIEVQAAAERLFHPIIATEAGFFSMFIVVFVFYGFLVLKRVVRSDYLFFMAFIALYAASFSLGSNFLHRDQVVEAGYVHAQAILGSLRTLVMLGLVTRVTGNRFGAVFRFCAAVAGGFLVLDVGHVGRRVEPDACRIDAVGIGACAAAAAEMAHLGRGEAKAVLMIHGRPEEAHRIVADIETSVLGHEQPGEGFEKIKLRMRDHTPLREVAVTLFSTYRQRSLVGLTLMAAQAFLYNAIFFTFALILTDFFGIAASNVGWYILPFAAGNFLGPLLLGRLYDTLGRRTMIALTYGISGVVLALSGYLFSIGVFSAQTQTIAWMVIFVFASPAAS